MHFNAQEEIRRDVYSWAQVRKPIDPRAVERARKQLRADVGARLREARKAVPLSQVKAAAQSHISRRQIIEIEKGENTSLDTIAILATAYGLRARIVLE